MKTVRLDEQERQERTKHRAQHIRKIEETERAAIAFLLTLTDRKHGYWDGGAHAGTPRDHGRRQPESRDQIVGGRRHGRPIRQPFEQAMPPNQFRRNHQGG